MPALKFTNSMNHEQVLNLDRVSSVEIAGSQASLIVYFGKDHININFRSPADRDAAFAEICRAYGVNQTEMNDLI